MLIIPVPSGLGDVLSIVILEIVGSNSSAFRIVRIVVILCSELNLIELLCFFDTEDGAVKSEPLTVRSLLARPQKFS